MLILGVENPQGEVNYICAAFPSACGKTNLAMLIPPEGYYKNGYRVWCVGDDISWIRKGEDGRLYAINPENGFFGVAPGTNMKSNPNALLSTKQGTIFTNVVHNLENNTVWWEGLDKNPPVNAVEWTGIETNGVDSSRYRLSFYSKIISPFILLVMMLVALSTIFGPLRSMNMGARILAGITLGFAYYVLNQIVAPFSLVYGIPPFFGAIFASVVFAILAVYLLRRKS